MVCPPSRACTERKLRGVVLGKTLMQTRLQEPVVLQLCYWPLSVPASLPPPPTTRPFLSIPGTKNSTFLCICTKIIHEQCQLYHIFERGLKERGFYHNHSHHRKWLHTSPGPFCPPKPSLWFFHQGSLLQASLPPTPPITRLAGSSLLHPLKNSMSSNPGPSIY